MDRGNDWFHTFGPRPQAPLRLFAFPYAGGNAGIFRRWSQGLGEAVEVWAPKLPGRTFRAEEAPLRDMAALIEGLTQGIAPLLDRPYALFGHSLGARVAYELAHALREGGARPPRLLMPSASGAPWAPRPGPTLHALPDEALIAALREHYGFESPVLAYPSLVRMALPTLRADLALLESHVTPARAPLDCPVAAFAGTHDGVAAAAAVEGWREVTRGPFTLHTLAGGHFFINDDPAALLARVRAALT